MKLDAFKLKRNKCMQNANITNLFNVLNIMLHYFNINSMEFELFNLQNQIKFYYFWFAFTQNYKYNHWMLFSARIAYRYRRSIACIVHNIIYSSL